MPDAVLVKLLNSQQCKVWDTLDKLVLGYFSVGGKSRQTVLLECAGRGAVSWQVKPMLHAVWSVNCLPSLRGNLHPLSGTQVPSSCLAFPHTFSSFGCPNSTQYFLDLWENIFLSVCHIWGWLAYLSPASGKLSVPLRDVWGWVVATGSLLALPLPPHPPDISASHACLLVLWKDTISFCFQTVPLAPQLWSQDVQAAFLGSSSFNTSLGGVQGVPAMKKIKSIVLCTMCSKN